MRPRITSLLVVDDSDDTRELLRGLLLDEGLQVLEANDGLKALHTVRGLPADVTCLVLLDIQMPVMNGLEFLEELRQVDRCSRFPVIVLSGSERIEDARRLPCVVAVVSKPFNDNDLMELIRQEARAIVGDVASLR